MHTSYVNTVSKIVERPLPPAGASNSRTIQTHVELMNARQDQYMLDARRQAAQVDATLSASLGARERIAAAYRAEIQCLNLTLGDYGALKSKVEELKSRLSADE